jgi:hypothetical protein
MAQVKSLPVGQAAKNRNMWMQGTFPFLIFAILIASCSPQKTAVPVFMSTRKPVGTSTVVSPRVTAAPEIINIQSGRFSLVVQPELAFEAHEDSISISDRQGELIVSLNGRPYAASSYTLQSFLGTYLSEMASRGGSFERGEPYEILIDGRSGLAVDFSGSFLDNPVTGKAVAVSPKEDFIVFGLGMSLLNEHENGWNESGSMTFEAILGSIDFKDEVK